MHKGITSHKAQQLQNQYGLNTITEQKKKPFLIKLFEQFNNFLIILLLLAAGFSFFVGETIDGSLILAIVMLNAFFGLYQESKAEEAIQALKKMTISKVRVIRDDKEQEIESKFLVPGDLIFIEEGVKIPADGIVVDPLNLEINEAVLTGESLAIAKDKKDEVYMGTIVAKGRGYISITKIGMKTKFGEIAAHLSQIETSKTPLQKKLEDLSRKIGLIGIAASFAVFSLSLWQDMGYFSSFLLAVSLAVAVVPEGLPAVMTIILSMGMKRMAKKNSIIRRLSAIEALGSITLIATDKTGTLTTNKMQVKEIYVDAKEYSYEKPPSLSNHPFSKMVLNGVLCSTASLVYIHDQNTYDVLGDPTEGALLFLAQKVGLMPDMIREQWKLIDEQPFDSVTKIMTVTVKNDKEEMLFSKGAPESIFERCDAMLIGEKKEPFTQQRKINMQKVLDNWARRGLRVLAFSYNGMFLGMVGIHDPPRPEVIHAMQRTHEAGIKTVMITGDNEKTAEAIGISTGLMQKGDEILTGKQLEEYSDAELLHVLPRVKIFARTTPFHKSRIVRLYQQLGEVVAVTGDGVNDAIALKQSDVGIAMGRVGTDVARETADMIITDDNFATIVAAVEEGRAIIGRLKKAIIYLLSCNVTEAFALILGILLGLPHLFYAIQLLYINLITDGIPALALAFSPKEEHIMKHPPSKQLQLLQNVDMRYISLIGFFSTVLVVGSFYVFSSNALIGKTAAFSVLVFIQSFIFVDMWLSKKPLLSHISRLASPVFIVAFIMPFFIHFIILSTPLFASSFKITTVSGFYSLGFIAIASLVLVGLTVVRNFRNVLYKK